MNPALQEDSHSSDIEQRIDGLISQLTLKEKVSLLSGQDAWNTVPIERLGIPSITMTDGPHGVRSNQPEAGRFVSPATSFPTGISMAASWDPELVARVGVALGEETRALGCQVLLGPCVNIVRTPLAGRNFESYAEDPCLAGRIGVAYVKGVQSQRVGTSLKHYACNNQEIERNRGNSVVDERTLREIYLPAFEAVVKEAHPWTVMCSYNRINGVYASENQYLLNEILKGEWGFDGIVVSDWGANHTTVESVKGGLDLEMPGPAKYYGKLLSDAVNTWQIDEAVIDESVRRLFRLIFRSGKFEDPAALPSGSLNTPDHQSLARELAEESITLLKNERGVLPLKPEQIETLAIIGPNAAEGRIGGGGSSYLEPPYRVSPLDGLRLKLGDRIEIGYAQGCDNFVELPVLKTKYITPAKGSGNGLLGEYFNNPDLAGEAKMERVDSKLDFWWFTPGPLENLTEDSFSARWSGKLTVSSSGLHTIKLVNTGTARLYLDGKLRIENSAGKLPIDFNLPQQDARLELVEGQPYDLRVEFIKPTGDPFAHLRLLFAPTPRPEDDDRLARAMELARKSDVVLVFAGYPEGHESEGSDRPDLELTGSQTELIRAVAGVNKNTIVVLNAGAPVTMPWLEEVAAVLEAYYPGQEGGHALARVLLGEVNPSGKLPVTFPRRLEDSPAFINYPGGKEVFYGERIYVGYRYYDQRNIEPLFPFGYGLSYTIFEYSNLQVPSQARMGEPVAVTLTVRNTGAYAGKEVVQLYVHDRQASLDRPPKELKGFIKVKLHPGESREVHFELDQRALSFYDPYQKRWVAEPGEFEVMVGSSSRDIRVQAAFELI